VVGPSSDSRLWLEETPVGASSAVNGRACRRENAGGDWSAAPANVQAATSRENCCLVKRTSLKPVRGQPKQPNLTGDGEGSYGRGMNHQMNSDSRRGKGSGMDAKRVSRQRREGETGGP